jgi:hypothetical protein
VVTSGQNAEKLGTSAWHLDGGEMTGSAEQPASHEPERHAFIQCQLRRMHSLRRSACLSHLLRLLCLLSHATPSEAVILSKSMCIAPPKREVLLTGICMLCDTQADDEQKVEGGSVREAVLTNLLLTALNQLRPTYVRCPEGKPSWLPDCLPSRPEHC